MGSFLLKDDNFEDEDQEKSFSNEDINYQINNLYRVKTTNRRVIFIGVVLILLLNIFLFWYFGGSEEESLIEIPANKMVKNYPEALSMKDDNDVYSLVSNKTEKRKVNVLKNDAEKPLMMRGNFEGEKNLSLNSHENVDVRRDNQNFRINDDYIARKNALEEKSDSDLKTEAENNISSSTEDSQIEDIKEDKNASYNLELKEKEIEDELIKSLDKKVKELKMKESADVNEFSEQENVRDVSRSEEQNSAVFRRQKNQNQERTLDESSNENFIDAPNIRKMTIEDDLYSKSAEYVENSVDNRRVINSNGKFQNVNSKFQNRKIVGKTYRLNIGVFLSLELAKDAYRRLYTKHNEIMKDVPYCIIPFNVNGGIVYKLFLGEFQDTKDVERYSNKLEYFGINSQIESF